MASSEMASSEMADGKDEPTTPAGASAPSSAEAKVDTSVTSDGMVMSAVVSPPLAPVIDSVPRQPVFAPAVAPAIEAVSSVRAPEIHACATEAHTFEPKPSKSLSARLGNPGMLLSSLRMPRLSRRMRWRGMIAASVAFAAGVGASIGAVAVGSRPPAPPAVVHDPVAAEEREAMQKTITRLGKEVTTLRTSLESANKAASAQFAKLADKVKESEKAAEQARRAAASPETTGSIASAAPVPVPVPRPGVAPVEQKPPVIEGWFIRSARDGMVLVENRGEIFEVVPGAPLPGLGRVEAIRRQDGRWVVVTPKGIIAAVRAPRPVYGRY